MNVVELFGGSCSFSKVAKAKGHNTFTSDWKQYGKIDYVTDIMDFDISKVPFNVDFIWASPPCTYFSVASIGKHWYPDHTPKSDNAMEGVAIVKKTMEIIKELNPSFGWIVENPRGKLRKLDLIDNKYLNTVTYCRHGDTRMKPTDLWTSLTPYWEPRKMCKNGDSCHVSAPRGSTTGTQGIKGAYNRSKVPEELCAEILEIVEQLTNVAGLPTFDYEVSQQTTLFDF